ncbi:MAG: hypothetical protein WA981_01340 [Glaciecola sp.]
MKQIIVIILILLGLSACVSVSPIEQSSGANEATVHIYRSDQLQGSAVDTYVGYNNDYYVSLAPSEFTTLKVPTGIQTFKVRAHADLSNAVTLDIQAKSEVCLLVEVNPQNIIGLNWLVSGYNLRQVACTAYKNNPDYVAVKN